MDLTQSSVPIVGKWIIKYDDVFQMPQFVQGIIIGDSGDFKNGQQVIIGDIEFIDLKDKTLRMADGKEFKLVGAGRRMLLLNEGDLLEFKYEDKRKAKKEIIFDEEDN